MWQELEWLLEQGGDSNSSSSEWTYDYDSGTFFHVNGTNTSAIYEVPTAFVVQGR